MSGQLPSNPEFVGPGPAIPFLLAFSGGVILLYSLGPLPPYQYLAAGGGLSVLLARCCRSRVGRRLLRLLAVMLLGMTWAAWQAESRLKHQLPSGLEGDKLKVSGYVCSLPQPGSFDSLRFDFCVQRWHGLSGHAETATLPETLRLSWYGRKGQSLPGHRLQLEVVLKRPHGSLNSSGFRYETWLYRHGFGATGSVRQVTADLSNPCALACQYRCWHLRVADTIEDWFGEARQFPLIASLLIGNRAHLEPDHWDTLKATGTIHLVAISGLHLGLVAVGVGGLARKLVLLLPPGLLTGQQRRVVVFGLVALASLVYALLAGFTVPTRRALVMVLAGGWFLLAARQSSIWSPYVLALALVLALDPFAPLDQGFWLSFGAVAVLLLVFGGLIRGPGWLPGLVYAQFAVFAGLWPILDQFGQVQPVAGLLANLLAIPWVSFVVMPVLLLGAALALISGGVLSGPGSMVMDGVLTCLIRGLEWIQSLSVPDLPAGNVVGYGVVALIALLVLRMPLPGYRRWVLLVAGCWLLALVTRPAGENSRLEVPEIRVLDVGQGLSVLVRAGNKVLIYDTGPEIAGVFSAVDSVLLPELRSLGIEQIDHLVLSHADNDHSGGLALLLERIPVLKITSGEPGVLTRRIGAGRTIAGCDPETLRWDALTFQFWQAPTPGLEGNDASCVLRLVHEETGADIWLTGDISRRIEEWMLGSAGPGWAGEESGFRIVLAPHHGSKTSSSPRWVAALAPDAVIYTAGYRHRFGHPHPEVTARYRQIGAQALNTACSGQISITLGVDGPVMAETRHVAPFWIAGDGLARDQCKIP
ncbi:MAG TPA: DNA internalization-related competence protein ComEC/Rec2 [Marinobacter sp.]|nr:DNA internalization-related competence protein ComEC/Rec2 [Marinobacter sp.]